MRKRYLPLMVGLSVLAFILNNFPILTLVNKPILITGIPLPYLFLFTTWFLLCFVLFWANRRHKA